MKIDKSQKSMSSDCERCNKVRVVSSYGRDRNGIMQFRDFCKKCFSEIKLQGWKHL